MKKSVQLIHPIGHDRSRQTKSMRDEELMKAEHLSTTNDPTGYNLVKSTKKGPFIRNAANAYDIGKHTHIC